MANWTDITFSAGVTDYIARLNALVDRSEAVATEVENARGGQANLLAHVQQQATIAEVEASLNALALTYSAGLTADFNCNNRRFRSLADPLLPQDCATRAWVLSQITLGGDPTGVPVTSLNVGTMGVGTLLGRSAGALAGYTIVAASTRVTVTVSGTEIQIDVPANAFARLSAANTWTEAQTFKSVEINDTAPVLAMRDTAAAADNQRWRWQLSGGSMRLEIGNDAGTAWAVLCQFTRTGNAPTGVAFSTDVSDSRGNLRDIPLNVQNAAYTFALSDRGRALIKTNTTAYAWTIPLESTVAFPDGTAITVVNDAGTGVVTITPTAGVTLLDGANTGSYALAVNSSRTLLKVGTNRWRVL